TPIVGPCSSSSRPVRRSSSWRPASTTARRRSTSSSTLSSRAASTSSALSTSPHVGEATDVTVETGRLAPDAVRTMFDRIAPVYDAMNRTMTAGLDRRWRAETARRVVSPGDRVLDACCGTGDLAVAAQRAGGKVIGLDFSERMLERARAKSDQVEWVQGDALALPFEDGSFDAATVGFGVRNLDDLEGGLRELRRVLRRGGRVGILGITRPRGGVRAC